MRNLPHLLKIEEFSYFLSFPRVFQRVDLQLASYALPVEHPVTCRYDVMRDNNSSNKAMNSTYR